MTAAWTWIIYIATHNDVARFGEMSVGLMRKATLGDHVHVLVQQDTPAGCKRLVVGANPEQVADLGEVDSGDPQTLLDCIQWAVQTAPAKRYALVLWSHGSGWQPHELDTIAKQVSPPEPIKPDELQKRSAMEGQADVFFSSSMRSMLAQPTAGERDIAFDNGSGHSLDTLELGAVIKHARGIVGHPLDLLVMNACQMSSAEVAYQLRRDARVFVASEDNMPASSLPYDDILSRLGNTPGLTPAALGRLIVARYAARYRADTALPWGQGSFPPGVTLVALSLSRSTRLAAAVKSLSKTLQADIDTHADSFFAAYRKAYAFRSFHLCDLASFCSGLLATGGQVAAQAQAVLDALADPTLRLAWETTAPAYAACAGLTTYLPRAGVTLSPFYATTAYSRTTAWGALLQAYHAAG